MSGRETAEARFWAKVNKTETCWLWVGASNPNGYGRFSVAGKLHYPHRWIYERLVQPIPTGYAIDHLCRQHACVRADHLEAVAWGENTSRGKLGFGLTGRCRSGLHDVSDPQNIYAHAGRRECRPCAVAAQQRRRSA